MSTIGVKTIGSPKVIGSEILKKAGTATIFIVLFRRSERARKSYTRTTPRVIPLPPISGKILMKVEQMMCGNDFPA